MTSCRASHFRRGVVSLLAILIYVNPGWAQDLRVGIRQSAAGGFAAGEEYAVFSSIGAAVPSGVMSLDSLRLYSGFLAYFPAMDPFAGLVHVPLRPAQSGRDQTISLTLGPGANLDRATLFYRRGGNVSYTEVEMSANDSGQLMAVIPAADVTSEGLAYYMELRDPAGRTVRTPTASEYGLDVRVGAPGLSSEAPLPGGSDQSAYRLFSVPLRLDESDAEAVLGDELGMYDPERWRFYELAHHQDVLEYPEARSFAPGYAFWLISSEARPAVSSGAGVSVVPTEIYSVPLHPRWNLIGNPFSFPLPVEKVSLRSSSTLAIRSFDGSWNDPIDESVVTLTPFVGYAVYNPSAAVDVLDFDPRASAASAGKMGAREALAWWIRIEARSGRSVDDDNIAGASHSASSGLDPMDVPEPPSVGAHVAASFRHPEAQSVDFSTDIRSATIDGGKWDVDLKSNTGEAIFLTIRGVETLPPTYRVLLLDETAGIIHDLRDSPGYQLADIGSRSVRRLQLIVGDDMYVSEHAAQLDEVPTTVELSPVFPNPVRSSMNIRYGLPEAAQVTVRLFTATGQLVHEVDRGLRPQGHHVIVWEASGLPGGLASGVYLLELRAGGVRRTALITKVG